MPVSDTDARGSGPATALVADRDPALRSKLAAPDPRPRSLAADHRGGDEPRDLRGLPRPSPGPGLRRPAIRDATGPEAVARFKAQGYVVPCLILVATQIFSRWTEVSQHLDAHEFLRLPLDEAHVAGLLQAHARRRQPTRLLLVDSAAQSRTWCGASGDLRLHPRGRGHRERPARPEARPPGGLRRRADRYRPARRRRRARARLPYPRGWRRGPRWC